MSALFELAKELGIDVNTVTQEELQEQVCLLATKQISDLAAQVERVRFVIGEYHSENIACEEAINELVFVLEQPESNSLAALNETPAQSLDTLKAEWQAEVFDNPVLEPSMKAGCIGEFSIAVEGAGLCPACTDHGYRGDCDICDGLGVVNITTCVPWDTQKAIFKAMCKYKARAIRQRAQETPATQNVTTYSGLLSPENLAAEHKELEKIYGKQQRKEKAT